MKEFNPLLYTITAAESKINAIFSGGAFCWLSNFTPRNRLKGSNNMLDCSDRGSVSMAT